MRWEEDPYEDELDRMRARRQRRGASRNKRSSHEDEIQWVDFDDADEDLLIEDLDLDEDPASDGNFASNEKFGSDRNFASNEKFGSGRNFASNEKFGSDRYFASNGNFDSDEEFDSDETPDLNGNPGEEETGRRPARTGGRIPPRPAGKNKKRRKKRHVFKLAVVLVLLLVGAFFVRRRQMGGYWTVAVFGVDSRNGNLGKGALSDVEMLCSINRQTGEIRLLSVFRDSYLRISADGAYDKINEAYFKGGHKQAVEALEANLDLKVDDYATFNWKAVVDAINALGGVDLEITDKEFGFINSFITETSESTGVPALHLEHSGMNHLDGVQAVAYARLRLMDTDFNRTERQRKVLGLVMEKAKQADVTTLSGVVAAVFPQISTSVGIDDVLAMAKNAKKYYIGQTSGFPFSHVETYVGKKSCVIPATLESNVIQLHAFLYDDTQYTPSATMKDISARIAQDSGIADEGRDTESGKNIGAQGNTGEEQQRPAETAPPAQTPATAQETPAAETPAPETSAEETAESSESPAESETGETTAEEIVPPIESSAEAAEPSESRRDEEAPETSEAQTGEGTGSGNGGSGTSVGHAPGEAIETTPSAGPTAAATTPGTESGGRPQPESAAPGPGPDAP